MIHPALTHLAVPVGSLVPDPQNARKHDERNLEAIRMSLRKFGQRLPLVVQRQGMVVRAGNGRLQAAKDLGWKEVAALVVDESEADAVAFAIADNRTAELAEWDTGQLRKLLDELPLEDPDLDRMLAELQDEVLPEIAPAAPEPDPVVLEPEFSVIVKCRDEREQRTMLAELDGQGRQVRALVVGFAHEEKPEPSRHAAGENGGGLAANPIRGLTPPARRIVRCTPVVRTPRVMQLEGLFDIPPSRQSEHCWNVSLALDRPWNVGLIVGPSGSGKTTVARELFGRGHLPARDEANGFPAGTGSEPEFASITSLDPDVAHRPPFEQRRPTPLAEREDHEWPSDKSIVDGFPESLSISEITGLLSSVGFSSPPSWLKPFHVLSNGEQFRVNLARCLAESPELAVVDEFTSVVDRTVARVGSAAVAKAVRNSGRRFVAVSCHYDIVDWLQPDWVLEMPDGRFDWRCLPGRPACPARPPLEIAVHRTDSKAWNLFRAHHYLNHGLNPAARCFVAELDGRPAAFTAVLHTPSGQGGYWREHRTVCLPDFQGVGIGNALSELIAGVFASTGKPYRSTTSHPAMIRHRLRSSLWQCTRTPSLGPCQQQRTTRQQLTAKFRRTSAVYRATASFLWRGPKRPEEAKRLGVDRRPA